MQSNIKVDAKIPLLTGLNYQEWKHRITAYLQAMDLWMVTQALLTRPVPADPNNITDDERQAIAVWDSIDYCAQGYLALYCDAPVYDQVEAHLQTPHQQKGRSVRREYILQVPLPAGDMHK
jgi:hypothetical protein